ncbi:MAG: M1 family metallopeptidase [Bacteroidales bacterium]|nr:M1 family metallopeptidase [Bacteroidales bacterium]
MRILCCLLFIVISYGLSATDRYPVNHIDVQHYKFTVYLSDSYDLIRGEARILLKHTAGSGIIRLDLKEQGVDGKGMEVEEVRVDGKPASWDHKDDRLSITLPENKSEGSTTRLLVLYQGIPADGLIISNNRHGDRTFFADNWPDRAHNWLPCVDHPSDKAYVDFIVYAPEKYKVVANGYLYEESVLPEGIKLTHWKEEISIPTKVMVIGVARFAIRLAGNVAGTKIWSYIFPEDRLEGFSDYSVAVDPFTWYSEKIGPYAYEKLANVQSKTIFGGMENAGCIFYSERSVTGEGRAERLIAHEIAHQWFGNSVTENDWHHVWLSEGFATYLTALYQGHKDGPRKLKAVMNMSRQRVIAADKRNPGAVVDTSIFDFMNLLSAYSYQKGAWVLHMLKNEMGDDMFWRCLQTYYARYRNRNALTDDFINTLEDVSGKDLDDFFYQWLYITGHPELELSWTYNNRKDELSLLVEQKQEKHVYKFPLELEISTLNGKKMHKIKVDERIQTFVFESKAPPLDIVPDPEVKLLFGEH